MKKRKKWNNRWKMTNLTPKFTPSLTNPLQGGAKRLRRRQRRLVWQGQGTCVEFEFTRGFRPTTPRGVTCIIIFLLGLIFRPTPTSLRKLGKQLPGRKNLVRKRSRRRAFIWESWSKIGSRFSKTQKICYFLKLIEDAPSASWAGGWTLCRDNLRSSGSSFSYNCHCCNNVWLCALRWSGAKSNITSAECGFHLTWW
jgi:hypothetical protein